jgi:hypothetical protein
MMSPVINGAAPTGTVTFFDGVTQIAGTPTVLSSPGTPTSNERLTASLMAALTTGGVHDITAKYSGDANYGPASGSLTLTAYYPTTASMTATAQGNILFGTTTTLTAIISTTVKSPPPTGKVIFYASYSGYLTDPVTQTIGTDASGNAQITAVTTTTPQNTETIYAIYNGDTNFASSASQSISFSVTTPDFSVVLPPTIVITAGQTGTGTLTFTPASKLNSTVMVSCYGTLPDGTTCSVNPSSVNLANGANGSAMVSLTTLGPSAGSASAAAVAKRRSFVGWFDFSRPYFPTGPEPAISALICWATSLATGLVAMCLLLVSTRRPRKRAILSLACTAALTCVVAFALGCGGGGGGGIAPPPQLATTTTVVSSPTAKVPAETPVTFTATVTSSRALSGTVTFYSDGSTLTPPLSLVNGSVQTEMTLASPGTMAVTAQYSGDTNNLPSTSGTFYQVTTGNTSFLVNSQTGIAFHQVRVNVTIQ